MPTAAGRHSAAIEPGNDEARDARDRWRCATRPAA
jgi:hypothetical protein